MLSEGLITKGERLNATLAHASIILGVLSRGVFGIVLAFLIWVTQRGEPCFTACQAAQAVVYQVIGLVATVAAWIGWGVLLTGATFVPALINPARPETLQPFTMIPALLLVVVPLAVMFGWIAYGLYAAWAVWDGRDFSYPLIGRWIR
jgi:uncharacterized Tic20 family protein